MQRTSGIIDSFYILHHMDLQVTLAQLKTKSTGKQSNDQTILVPYRHSISGMLNFANLKNFAKFCTREITLPYLSVKLKTRELFFPELILTYFRPMSHLQINQVIGFYKQNTRKTSVEE